MPEREIICLEPEGVTTSQFIDNTKKLTQMFNDGWVFDPLLQSRIVKLEHSIIYHLIKYSEGELEQLQEEELQEPEIESVKSVSYEEVDALISKGYKPRDYYAKNVTMIKIKEVSET